MTKIAVTREDGPGGGRYVAIVDGLESELSYSCAIREGQKVIVAEHTGVPQALSGRGIGLALVARAVEDAQAEGLKIAPHCSFVRVHLQRNRDWRNLVAE
jgi:predicted GNAT family acetyltransferase